MATVQRDRTFLNYFYDLASEDKQTRLNSANSLVSYVRSCLLNSLPSDPEYALKRLVRGLASSREYARQGFATCLCELLTMKEMDIKVALQILDENTKVMLLNIMNYWLYVMMFCLLVEWFVEGFRRARFHVW